MDNYRYVFFSAVQFVSWWIMAGQSYPEIPQEPLRIVLLILGSVSFAVLGYLFNKEKRYFPTLFCWSLSMMPWAFFGEMLYVFGKLEGLTSAFLETNYLHAVTVYNLFRYFILAATAVIIFREFLQNLKKIG